MGQQHGFEEVVLRAEGRYDLQWKINGEKHFLDKENVMNKFLPFVHDILGGAAMTSLNFNGCLVSLPGAKEQLWHIDGEHLFSSEPAFQCTGNTNVEFFRQSEAVPESILPGIGRNISD